MFLLFAVALLPFTDRFFFFNDTATTEIYTLSLHDALPISLRRGARPVPLRAARAALRRRSRPHLQGRSVGDRKSTRLNSSHGYISYAVFCLKKKKQQHTQHHYRTTRPCRHNHKSRYSSYYT